MAVIAGLLFLAFAYFLVGQAALTRNGAQTAADAAALAAAQDARDQLRDGWLAVILDPDQWDGFLKGRSYSEGQACGRAAEFASRNEARFSGGGCVSLATGEPGFRVTVTTTGGEPRQATASAEAVIEPLCSYAEPEPSPDPPTSPPSSTSPTPTPSPGGDGEEPDEEGPLVGLTCDGEPWVIEPDSPVLPSAAELFRVRLSD
ncbi:pilus assembly protein TadG-related protein [Streptomyces sp. NPDC047141]|uniref:pilus assembly protein TadG-related protein n=1 Tax=Streptomyces sp. NPDC047141 TaxID=3155738 RepID=UPI0034019F93